MAATGWEPEFYAQHRDKAMWQITSTPHQVGVVPVFRAHALMLAHAHAHDARFTVLSGSRRDADIRSFNQTYGTNLHSQLYLYEHQHEPGFNPANPPGFSSHELRADGNPVFRRTVASPVLGRGKTIPNFMLGIDAVDDGSRNDCTRLLNTLHSLGYHAVRPYPAGSEAHHLVCTSSPVAVLEHWNVISKERNP